MRRLLLIAISLTLACVGPCKVTCAEYDGKAAFAEAEGNRKIKVLEAGRATKKSE